MAIDPNTGVEEIRPEDKQIPGVHPHMRPSPKSYRYQPYPKMLYRGDSYRIVKDEEEKGRALEAGWMEKRESVPALEASGELLARRGPGRPRKVE